MTCMLSKVGLDAGRDKQCGLLPSHLDVVMEDWGHLPVLMSTSLVEVVLDMGKLFVMWAVLVE